jgi:fibrillarin-like rRNA methylase
MKAFKAILVVLVLMALVPLAANANNMKAYEQMVENIDAVQAMAFANQWKWTQNNIKTYVTPKEVVFEFPNKTIKKVALPKDKMVVAIAPYLTYTHG